MLAGIVFEAKPAPSVERAEREMPVETDFETVLSVSPSGRMAEAAQPRGDDPTAGGDVLPTVDEEPSDDPLLVMQLEIWRDPGAESLPDEGPRHDAGGVGGAVLPEGTAGAPAPDLDAASEGAASETAATEIAPDPGSQTPAGRPSADTLPEGHETVAVRGVVSSVAGSHHDARAPAAAATTGVTGHLEAERPAQMPTGGIAEPEDQRGDAVARAPVSAAPFSAATASGDSEVPHGTPGRMTAEPARSPLPAPAPDVSGLPAPQGLEEIRTISPTRILDMDPPPARPASPLVRNVVDQLARHAADDGRITLQLRPHGMGLIEMEIVRDAAGRQEIAMRVHNPMVLDALRAERPAMLELLSGHGASDSLSLDLQRGGEGRDGGKPMQGGSSLVSEGEGVGEAAASSEMNPSTSPLTGGTNILI